MSAQVEVVLGYQGMNHFEGLVVVQDEGIVTVFEFVLGEPGLNLALDP